MQVRTEWRHGVVLACVRLLQELGKVPVKLFMAASRVSSCNTATELSVRALVYQSLSLVEPLLQRQSCAWCPSVCLAKLIRWRCFSSGLRW